MTSDVAELLQSMVGLLAAAILVGGGGGILGIIAFLLSRAKGERALIDAIEKLYESIPVTALKVAIRDAVELANRATDGQPNDDDAKG
jgi:hypothetical protein